MNINKFFYITALLISFNFENIQCLVDLASAKANSVLVQSDGKIVAVGTVNMGGVPQGLIVRYNSNGTLDNAFNGGVVTTVVGDNAVFNNVLQQSDGKLVVVGSANLTTNPQYIAVRYNANGTLDNSFGNQGIATTVQGISSVAYAVAQQSDGKLVLTGYSSPGNNPTAQRFFTARLNGNGTLDSGFGSGGVVFSSLGNFGIGFEVVIQPADNKIVIMGSGSTSFAAVRYLPNGTLDTTFGSSGIASFSVGAVVQQCVTGLLQPDGKFVLGGYGDNAFGLIRLTSAGLLDTTFGIGGRVLTSFASPAEIFALVLQADGNIVAAGYMDNQVALARYTTAGLLDPSYGSGGLVTTAIGSSARALGAALQSNGKIVVAGESAPNLFVTRYNTNGSVDSDFGVVSSPAVCGTALCAYGQVYNISTVDILNNQGFTFDSNGILNGITHSTSSNTQNVVIGQAGTYVVNYIVESNSPAVLQLLQNGSVVPAASFTSQVSSTAVGRAIINANAGDTLTLLNLSGYDIALVGGSGINASLDLAKIA